MDRKILITQDDLDLLVHLLDERLGIKGLDDDRASLQTLREHLSRAEIVDQIPLWRRVITIGTTFKILNLFNMEEFIYTMVLPDDADLKCGRLSVFDPLGATLLGYREGDVVEFDPPYTGLQIKIVNIIDRAANVVVIPRSRTTRPRAG